MGKNIVYILKLTEKRNNGSWNAKMLWNNWVGTQQQVGIICNKEALDVMKYAMKNKLTSSQGLNQPNYQMWNQRYIQNDY